MESWYVVKHVSRDLWATQNTVTLPDGSRGVLSDRPWFASEENPYLVYTRDEAEEIRTEMEVPADWEVVHVGFVELEDAKN